MYENQTAGALSPPHYAQLAGIAPAWTAAAQPVGPDGALSIVCMRLNAAIQRASCEADALHDKANQLFGCPPPSAQAAVDPKISGPDGDIDRAYRLLDELTVQLDRVGHALDRLRAV